MLINITLTPCMVPVNNAANTTDNAVLLPVTPNNTADARAPVPKITPAHNKGFLKYLRYSFAVASQHIMLKIGSTTLVKIEITLLTNYTNCTHNNVNRTLRPQCMSYISVSFFQ